MIKVIKSTLLVFCLFMTACVTVEETPHVIVNGAAGYLEKVVLPQGCSITIAIVDLDTRNSILAQKSFDIARAPVPFKFFLSPDKIKDDVNYGVVAMIQHKGKLLYQTYDHFPVINNDEFTAAVLMKAVP
ncbi:YbaY family lipoprotein [Shewanella sp. VB17]|uniref:YbaY family lipoprotein n=1 Tax=Shewanella sp. VB17 TaxID=2739432 RepID=UPI0015676991|nr:YbaY family lipoprotein [Shewanella sp. VB17]NRD74791.1 YbaY family lipoprotein [Shewanella sp. VB17]